MVACGKFFAFNGNPCGGILLCTDKGYTEDVACIAPIPATQQFPSRVNSESSSHQNKGLCVCILCAAWPVGVGSWNLALWLLGRTGCTPHKMETCAHVTLRDTNAEQNKGLNIILVEIIRICERLCRFCVRSMPKIRMQGIHLSGAGLLTCKMRETLQVSYVSSYNFSKDLPHVRQFPCQTENSEGRNHVGLIHRHSVGSVNVCGIDYSHICNQFHKGFLT